MAVVSLTEIVYGELAQEVDLYIRGSGHEIFIRHEDLRVTPVLSLRLRAPNLSLRGLLVPDVVLFRFKRDPEPKVCVESGER
jgi:hypothetical protein